MNKEKLDKIESKIDEALANETPEKHVGYLWDRVEKENPLTFVTSFHYSCRCIIMWNTLVVSNPFKVV